MAIASETPERLRRLYELLDEGLSHGQAAAVLNDAGSTTPTGRRWTRANAYELTESAPPLQTAGVPDEADVIIELPPLSAISHPAALDAVYEYALAIAELERDGMTGVLVDARRALIAAIDSVGEEWDLLIQDEIRTRRDRLLAAVRTLVACEEELAEELALERWLRQFPRTPRWQLGHLAVPDPHRPDSPAPFAAVAAALRAAATAIASTPRREAEDWERETIDERLAALRSNGKRHGPPAVADRPDVALRIAYMRAQGETFQTIADKLNTDGVPTLRGGSEWRPSSVQAAAGYRRRSAAASP